MFWAETSATLNSAIAKAHRVTEPSRWIGSLAIT